MRYVILAVALAAAPSAAFAQTVYKCKSGDGATVYSQQPCSSTAEARVVKGQGVPSDRGDQTRVNEMMRNVDESRAQAAEDRCLRNANDRIYPSSNRRIAEHERRIAALNSEIGRARNNLAGATWQSGLRNEIAGLQQAIATERATTESVFAAERQTCTDARRREEEKIANHADEDGL